MKSLFVKIDLNINIPVMLAAAAGLVLFFLLMSNIHPTSHIAGLRTQDEVTAQSRSYLEQAGFHPDQLTPFTVFRTNEVLRDQQIAHFGKNRLNYFIENGFLRFIPTWHWQVSWYATGDHEQTEISMQSFKQPGGVPVLRTDHSPDGAVQQFHLEDSRGLEMRRNPGTASGPFHLSETEAGPLNAALPGHPFIKNKLSRTVWDNYMMHIDSLYTSELFDEPAIAVRLSPQADIFEHSPQITLTVSNDGELLGIHQDVAIHAFAGTSDSEQAGLFRTIFYILAILLILTLFFRRLFYRLIDVHTASVYALIAFGLCLLHLLHLLLQVSAFEQFHQFLQLIVFFGTILLLCGLLGLMVFMLAGLAESFSREVWPDKIASSSMLRLGYLKSRLTGHAIVTGVLAAMVYLGIASAVYTFFDHSFLEPIDDQLFYAHSYLLPGWQVGIRSLFWTAILSAGLFACSISWFAANRMSKPLLLLSGGILFALMTSLYLDTPFSSLALIIGFLPGAAMTYVFLRYDLLTLAISMLLFFAVWTTVDGLFVTGSPDALLARSVFGGAAILLLAGGYLLLYGDDYEHIPELTPDYIREIAREQRVERELEIAHQVHQTFLPTDLPEFPGVELAANCQPAFDVGGDYYDVIPVDDQRIAFIIGDVSGKGIQAAFYMTMVKGIFHSLVREIPEPIPLLTRLNRLFYANARRGSFISLCYGLLDRSDSTLTYARAGHNPAILFRAANNAENNSVSMLRTTGLAIGLTGDEKFEQSLAEEKTVMHAGDTLVFYTDGLTEAVDHANRMFGDERLMEEIRQGGHLSAKELMRHLNDRVSRFTGKTPVNDDRTMVIVRVTPRI